MKVPYRRLSGFYFGYFAALGVIVPYWTLYLQELGFKSTEIGELMAIWTSGRILAPSFWAWFTEQVGQPMRIVRWSILITTLCFSLIFGVNEFWKIAAITVLFSFFWNAALPQFEVVTITHLGSQFQRYSRIRVWGSIGFIALSFMVGKLLETESLYIIPLIIFSTFVGTWLVSLSIPESKSLHHENADVSFKEILFQPVVLALLMGCFLMQASHGAYYTFYSPYLAAHGYSKTWIGALWSLGVLAEVVLFLVMPNLSSRFNNIALFLLAFLLAGLRWLMIAFGADFLIVLLFAQLLHAASFGLYHVVSIQLITKYFSGKYQGRGQALYGSVSYGMGGAIGMLYAGYVYEINPIFAFIGSSLFCFTAYFIIRYITPEFSQEKTATVV
jgi:MFS transporter, PPP family, 3-phenylpropionic acid transporter